MHGGFGGAPKFPQSRLSSSCSGAAGSRDRATTPAARRGALTLDRMCQGGIYDHLGGGFARYSVDTEWLMPHFEKMLYDNAQLLDLLPWSGRRPRARSYAARIAETIDWDRCAR